MIIKRHTYEVREKTIGKVKVYCLEFPNGLIELNGNLFRSFEDMEDHLIQEGNFEILNGAVLRTIEISPEISFVQFRYVIADLSRYVAAVIGTNMYKKEYLSEILRKTGETLNQASYFWVGKES